MAFDCPSSTRSYSCPEPHEEGSDRIESGRNHVSYYSRNSSKERDWSPNSYVTNSSGKEVIIKRGRPRKQWPEHSEPRQNMYHQEPKYDDEQIPSLALPIQPTNQHYQDDSGNTQLMDGIRKHASRRVNRLEREPRSSLCVEDKWCYPTRTQIGSAFVPARGQCCGPCCHANLQKYSEPYFLPCYPLVVQDEQAASPRLERDICYSNTQLQHKYSLAQSPRPPQNPIIIDCFSLAVNEYKEEITATSTNQYDEEEPSHHKVTNQSKSRHDCVICQQIATGKVLSQFPNTSAVHPNECCYRETNQTNSPCIASSTRHTNDQSCWHNTAIEGEDVHGKTSRQKGPEDVGFEPMTMEEEKRTVIKSAFSSPNGKKLKSSDYESNLQVLRRQETRARTLDAKAQESLSLKNASELPTTQPSVHYFTATNTATLNSNDNMTGNSRNDDLQRKWEAMYHILEEPDKTNKKSYFCSHCGRAFTHLSSLNNHIRTHTGQKPFRCRYCGKRFAQSGVLTAHLRTHTGEKPFNCILCGKRFAQTTTLANHIRTHTGQKPFSCRYCKRTFAQSSTRNKHELSHTKEKPFECKYCGRSFTQSATVMRHMRIHMRDTKYSCVHCGKTFAYLYSLDKHLDEHT